MMRCTHPNVDTITGNCGCQIGTSTGRTSGSTSTSTSSSISNERD